MALLRVPSELLLSTHLLNKGGWTGKLTVGLWLLFPRMGLKSMQVDLTRFETLRLNHSATTAFVSFFAVIDK